jgi:hypothetical protein
VGRVVGSGKMLRLIYRMKATFDPGIFRKLVIFGKFPSGYVDFPARILSEALGHAHP